MLEVSNIYTYAQALRIFGQVLIGLHLLPILLQEEILLNLALYIFFVVARTTALKLFYTKAMDGFYVTSVLPMVIIDCQEQEVKDISEQ